MNINIVNLESTTFSARRFTRKQIAQIQDTVGNFHNLSLSELGHTICEHLNWKNPKGSNKIQSCLKALKQMEELGLFTLPATKTKKKTSQKQIVWTEKTEEHSKLCCDLAELENLRIQKVTDKEDILLWNEFIDRYHYLKYRKPIGDNLRYFIIAKVQNEEILGCLSFSSTAVWSLTERDQWLAWTKKDREKRLNLILNNTRFLIFPWVRINNLASKTLSMISKRIAIDWLEHHGYEPVLLETFVNPDKYQATCYRAANWQYLGQTSGRSWNEISSQTQTSKKNIYVYPLHKNFREILKNTKVPILSKQKKTKSFEKNNEFKSDELFHQMWQKIIFLVSQISQNFDQIWQKRQRTINTMLIMLFIFRLVFSKNKQGYQITIQELWNQCRQMNFELPQDKPVAPSAMCNARKKLDENIFKVVNTEIIKTYESENFTSDYSWKQHRLFAVDGTKINLPLQLSANGYKVPSKNSNYPQGLVSCIFQLKSKIPYDFDLISHNNERTAALAHLKILNKGDVVTYDRGYFSYLMLYHHLEHKIEAIFRMKNKTFKNIDTFINSDKTDQIIEIELSIQRKKEIISQNPILKLKPLKLRLIKYTISTTTYTLGTTLLDNHRYPAKEFPDLYHSRWGIEELYKISKVLLDVEDFHGQSERGVKQELFAHFALITFNRLFVNQAEKDINIEKDVQPLTNDHSTPTNKYQLNVKNSLITIARFLEGLFIKHTKLVKATINKVITNIINCKQKVRPGRKFERISKKPINKWRPSKA